jgi:Asparagine synthase
MPTTSQVKWDYVSLFSCIHNQEENAVVWGAKGDATAHTLMDFLLMQPKNVNPPDFQWAAAIQRSDGAVIATASAMLGGGLYWSIDHDRGSRPYLLIGVSPGDVVLRRKEPTTLDHRYIREYLSGGRSARKSPYNEVHRVPAGVFARWHSIETPPEETEWSGPDAWAEPHLEGRDAREAYLNIFDATIAKLIEGDAPLASMLSGGLDSSFVVTALARMTTPDRPVHAFVHAPHPDARLSAIGNWDPDDSEFAKKMEAAYPGRVVVSKIINTDLVQPQDAALRTARRSWMPTFNPGNQIWMDAIAEQAAAIGASMLFSGEKGNAAFSHEHSYAASYYLQRGRLDQLAKMVFSRADSNFSLYHAARKRVLGPLISPWRLQKNNPNTEYNKLVGVPDSSRVTGKSQSMGRRQFLEWLSQSYGALSAAGCPAGWILPVTDPFTASEVLAMAASITPRQWLQGPYPRGYARLLGVGRVPDEIRLRTRRGGQAWDTWFVIRNQRERYLDELELVHRSPGLGGWVDTSEMQKRAEQWPWGEIEGPSHIEVIAIDRLLSLAAFARMSDERLNTINKALSNRAC